MENEGNYRYSFTIKRTPFYRITIKRGEFTIRENAVKKGMSLVRI